MIRLTCLALACFAFGLIIGANLRFRQLASPVPEPVIISRPMFRLDRSQTEGGPFTVPAQTLQYFVI